VQLAVRIATPSLTLIKIICQAHGSALLVFKKEFSDQFEVSMSKDVN
jgi:hypothetical protein